MNRESIFKLILQLLLYAGGAKVENFDYSNYDTLSNMGEEIKEFTKLMFL